jgi:cell division protein ZapA
MQKPIRVHILDREYPLRVTETDEAFTREVAEFVDERLRGVRDSLSGQPDVTHAVLGALSIAEELFNLRHELESLRHRVGEEASAALARLDEVLAEEAAPEPAPKKNGKAPRISKGKGEIRPASDQ